MQFGKLKRREFMALLGGAAAALALSAHAQQITEKLLTIGILGSSAPSTQSRQNAALVQRLHELAWTEGGNVKIEVRWAEGRNERFAEIAAEFVALKVNVIVTSGA